MKCHYEVLGVEREADEAQIKTAYRKLALKCHPDKNLDDPEKAKTLFQAVQQAYEILSDPQERAWYDKHREQILRGASSDYEDNSLVVYQYFTTSCYSGFNDDEQGFYTVFRKVFEQLAAEEVEFLDSPEEFEAIPKFGDSTSDYEEVVAPFYAFWQSFCTKKSYAWLSTHNINEIRDRRILKVVEKENKKVQQKARKERNEEIRSLVSFVRKRDRRVQAHRKLLEERAVENRKRQAQLDLEQVLKRKEEVKEQMKNQSQFLNDGYEEQLRQLEKAIQSEDEDDGDEDTGGEDESLADHMEILDLDSTNADQLIGCELMCVACNKTFKNQSSYRNHESSKKHKENVELLRREMLQEDEMLRSEGESLISDDQDVEEVVVETQTASKAGGGKGKKKKKQKTAAPVANSDSEDDEPVVDFLAKGQDSDEDDWNAPSSSSKKTKGKTKGGAANKKEPKEKKVAVEEKVIREEKKKKPEADREDGDDSSLKCVTCSAEFPSKNKLFAHLKSTNHGVYLPKNKSNGEVTGKKSKKAK